VKVLVTGGAGYIGSVTAETLLRAGHEVTIFDSLLTGHLAAVPQGAQFEQGTLLDAAAIRAAIARHRPEAVLHFGARALVGESMQDPLAYLGDNVQSGIHLFRAAIEGGVRGVVFSSTSNLFDGPGRMPIAEDAAPAPSSPYGESKYILERMLSWLDKTQGFRSVCLRYFNAAGATEERGECHDPETHLIPIVLQAAQGKRKEVTIFGGDYDTPDGTCIRDYTHVADIADAHVLALGALGSGSRTYHLGSGKGASVRDVIESARRVTGRAIPSVIGPRRPGDPTKLVADAALIRRELGWTPRFLELDGIIGSAWRWMERHPRGYAPGL
jgi:UDP-glucose 4-epimerase